MRLASLILLVCTATSAIAADLTPAQKRATQQLWEDISDGRLASFYNGNKLLEASSNNRSEFIAYIAGVHDALKVKGQFCSPEYATNGQVADVVAKYLTNNPETRATQAQILIRIALTDAWPCPPSK